MHLKLPLVFEPQPEGGYTVTSPLLPELITEGDSMEDAVENVRDALAAVVEIYREQGKELPASLVVSDATSPLWAEMVIAVP
jgi:antitoxin HicB